MRYSVHIGCDDLQGLLEILSSASEFDDLPIRPGEEEAIRKLLMHAAVAVDKPRYTDPHTKANALLQARWLPPCEPYPHAWRVFACNVPWFIISQSDQIV